MKKLFLIICTLFIGLYLFGQSVLDAEVVDLLSSAVYEVVVQKLPEDNYTYEKELPLDRIPFQIRNDKYNSIGTAFLMDDGYFYSAAHVLALAEKSLYNEYFIRDSKGNVFSIDNIVKFATNRDFVLFTVKDFDIKSAPKLTKAKDQEVNTTVYSVGNALGDGVVIRDGLYTSQTFEIMNGEWKWLRFSAAASPGNSGGPLVNSKGEVLGIVTMKSQNENLNYALPFSETKNVEDNKGILKVQAYYNMPNIICDKFYTVFENTIDLPKTIEQVQNHMVSYMETATQDVIKNKIYPSYNPLGEKGFMKENSGLGFVDDNYRFDFPCLTCKNETLEWDIYYPQKINELQLENDGKLYLGSLLGYFMAYIEMPKDKSLEELINNPKIYMDYFQQGFGLSRNVAGERIRITSFGEPSSSETYMDRLNRKWFLNYWNINFANSAIILATLPLPNGLFIIGTIGDYNTVYVGHNFDLKFMTDYIFPTYVGTIKNWKDFLTLNETLNPKYSVQNAVQIKEDKKEIYLNCNEISLAIPNDLFNGEELNIELYLGYNEIDNELHLIPEGISAYVLGKKEAYFSAYTVKMKEPSNAATEKVKKYWSSKIQDEVNVVNYYTEDDYQYAETMLKKCLSKDGPDCVYLFSLRQSNVLKDKTFKKNAKNILKKSSIE